jgi:hypothetical protein
MPPSPNERTPTLFSDVTPVTLGKLPFANTTVQDERGNRNSGPRVSPLPEAKNIYF